MALPDTRASAQGRVGETMELRQSMAVPSGTPRNTSGRPAPWLNIKPPLPSEPADKPAPPLGTGGHVSFRSPHNVCSRTAHNNPGAHISILRCGHRPKDDRTTACHCFTMSGMRTAKTVSITLPPDLLAKAQEYAQREHRTMSDLFREALRRYMAGDQEWDSLLQRTRAKGKTVGVTSEADVERLSDEYRRSKRR